ncbi:MAG: hypothetical protein RR368_04250 [Oscillospiraceae bacterium]
MKEKKIIRELEQSDERYTKGTDSTAKKRAKSARCIGILSVAACLAVVAVSLVLAKQAGEKKEHEDIATKKYGEAAVYIPKIELLENQQGAAADMIGVVVYNGKIYTHAEYMYGDDEAKSKFIGEFLGSATGEIDEWSQPNDYKKELASNVAGEVYTVKGYDRDFRICILNTYGNLAFFENLNDINLTVGEDLYGEKRLNLRGNINKTEYQLHEDWDWAKGNIKELEDLPSGSIDAFVAELYKGEFEDLSKCKPSIYSQELKQAHLYFRMKDGTCVQMRLFENGYVGYSYMNDSCFVKIDNEIFTRVFDAALK